LVDGATINNLPVDVMQRHAPGLVIGSDVGADNAHNGKRRLTIFRILVYFGLVNSAASAAAQRKLADVLLRPPLANVDLLNWQAFDRAIEAGYAYACRTLEELPHLPRLRDDPCHRTWCEFPRGRTRPTGRPLRPQLTRPPLRRS